MFLCIHYHFFGYVEELWLFTPLPVRLLACSPSGLFAPGFFAPWLICSLTLDDSPTLNIPVIRY